MSCRQGVVCSGACTSGRQREGGRPPGALWRRKAIDDDITCRGCTASDAFSIAVCSGAVSNLDLRRVTEDFLQLKKNRVT